jgi:hypothetical protein
MLLEEINHISLEGTSHTLSEETRNFWVLTKIRDMLRHLWTEQFKTFKIDNPKLPTTCHNSNSNWSSKRLTHSRWVTFLEEGMVVTQKQALLHRTHQYRIRYRASRNKIISSLCIKHLLPIVNRMIVIKSTYYRGQVTTMWRHKSSKLFNNKAWKPTCQPNHHLKLLQIVQIL